MNIQKQKIVNWSEQALEILGTALLQNRSNMAYTMLSSTEMIVRCKEDNWRILMTEAGLFHLYHNNYVMIGETERRFTNGYHDQNVESANLQELINYIAGYSWDKHLQSKGIDVDRTIFKIRTIKDGEISRSILLKRNELNEYTFFPYKHCIRDIFAFEGKKKRMQKMMLNILMDGKNSSYELFGVIDETKKAIYIAEGVFNVYWQHIRCENVDLSQVSLSGKKAFVGRDFKIQYTGILEPEQETQNLISKRNNALGDDKYKYVVSDMDNWVHHKSCKKVDDIKYWEFEALEEIPAGRKVCPCCQDKIYTRGEYITTSDTEMKKRITIKRGDVYYADLTGIEQSIGCEQTGKRPVLVIQNDIGNNHSTTTIVAVVTTKIKKNLPTHVILTDFKGLQHTSAVCLEQIKTIDKSRLEDYCGNIGALKMNKIDKAIMVSVGIKPTNKSEDRISYDNVTRIETYPLPKSAVREAIYNALIHSDYSALIPIQIRIHADEVYISNDCVLPVGWTVETLMEKHRSEPHNPNIANAFFRAGYVETWGRGIEKICEACKKHGVPNPEYMLHPGDIMIKFTPLQVEDEDVNKNISEAESNEIKNETSFETSLKQVLKQSDYVKLESIIVWLARKEQIRIQEVMQITKKSRATAWRYMQKLLDCGAVEVTGSTNNIIYKRKY